VNALLLAALFLQTGGGVIERAAVRANAEVSFHAVVAPETVYVGQAARYELGVFIRDDIRQRLRRNPEFVPPDLRALFSYDLREDSRTRLVQRNGQQYEVHRFRRALYPVAPGRIVVPPARLSYVVPLGASYFSREETRSLQSESVTIVAIQPPEQGRPSQWAGAVGDLTLRAGVVPAEVRRGDPFVYTLRVSGAGNVGLFPRPVLEIPGATVVASDERVRLDSLPEELRGEKAFDWLVTPDVTGALVIPVSEYAYFDPLREEYRVARAGGGSITVRDAERVQVDTAPSAVVAPRARVALAATWGGERAPSPLRQWWFWLLVALAPLPAAVGALRRRGPRVARAVSARERLDRTGAEHTPSELRALVTAALVERLGTPIAWAAIDPARRALRRAGVTATTAERVVTAVAQLDEATFGPTRARAAAPPDLATLRTLVTAVDREAVRRVRRHATSTVAALVLVIAALASAQQRSAAEHFRDGLAAFDRDPALAADAFFSAARAAPRASSAWQNAAIASWAAADTARAVVAWQRVVRLDPFDASAREQLRVIGASSALPRADVWPVPTTATAWLALVLWVAVCVGAARGSGRAGVLMGALAALVVLAVAVAAEQRARVEGLAVVAQAAPLRALPALGSEAGATPLTGELVEVVERGPIWVRVRAGRDREGWMDANHLLGLDGRRLRD
jgi:hypothetical protein